MGDYSRCKHGDLAGYCMQCNEYCPQCGGSGEVKAMTQAYGPDDYEYDVECPTCKGLGLVDRQHPPQEAKP